MTKHDSWLTITIYCFHLPISVFANQIKIIVSVRILREILTFNKNLNSCHCVDLQQKKKTITLLWSKVQVLKKFKKKNRSQCHEKYLLLPSTISERMKVRNFLIFLWFDNHFFPTFPFPLIIATNQSHIWFYYHTILLLSLPIRWRSRKLFYFNHFKYIK